MKKLILLTVALTTFIYASSQVVAGISPSSVQQNFDYSVQASAGGWPGQTDDGSWGFNGSGLNFNNPGNFIIDTLMLVEDGTLGLNGQGNPISQEGCDTLTNDLTGKIAVIYRNTCSFSSKVYYAQMAGAVAVVIINREDNTDLLMSANTDPMLGDMFGILDTIPAVFLSSSSGEVLTAAMATDDVVMFIGNKTGAFTNDVASQKAFCMISRYGSIPQTMANNGYTFDLGMTLYNEGTASNTISAIATIDGPSGNIYTDSVFGISMNTGDTLNIFSANTNSFAALSVSTWDIGEYTLTYSINLSGQTDDFNYDNVFTSNFYVTNDVLSLARQDSNTNMVLTNTYPYANTAAGAFAQERSCAMIQDVYPNTSTGVEGMYFAAYSHKASGSLDGAYVQAEIVQWDDPWTAVNGSWANITFNVLSQVGFIDYIYDTSHVNGDVVYAPFSSPVLLVDNQRYLVCLNTFSGTDSVSFGYDSGLDYNANYAIYDKPIGALNIDNTWYGGWNSADAVTIGLKLAYDVGVIEDNTHSGILYPNPANDLVNISFSDINNFNANITIYDIMGKVIKSNTVNNVSNNINYDVSDLSKGTYIFNIIFEDGKTSNFNVVITR